MKLYFSPGVCSLAPHIIAKESGLPIEGIKTDLKAKTTEGGGNYLGKNPLGYVPALELNDGSIMTEAGVIAQYIADQAPQKKLAPAAGTPDRYKMMSWLNFISTELHKGFTPMVAGVFAGKQTPELTKVYMERLRFRFAHVEKHLATHQYLVGDAFSCADAYLYTVSRWTPRVGIELAKEFPHVAAFQKRCEQRAGVKAALAAEGLPAA